ncbi:HAD-IA family hydrolase, partial [Candidatus Woesebacteria bacterium]|nr:HAD-IA family hydrolase [Candidatus Woesebacteria bacterium]
INWDAHTHSCDIGFVKPEIEIYQIATEKAKTNPEEILFIDDNNNFIEGAKKIGWQTFLFDEENPRDSVFQLRTLLNLN